MPYCLMVNMKGRLEKWVLRILLAIEEFHLLTAFPLGWGFFLFFVAISIFQFVVILAVNVLQED